MFKKNLLLLNILGSMIEFTAQYLYIFDNNLFSLNSFIMHAYKLDVS